MRWLAASWHTTLCFKRHILFQRRNEHLVRGKLMCVRMYMYELCRKYMHLNICERHGLESDICKPSLFSTRKVQDSRYFRMYIRLNIWCIYFLPAYLGGFSLRFPSSNSPNMRSLGQDNMSAPKCLFCNVTKSKNCIIVSKIRNGSRAWDTKCTKSLRQCWDCDAPRHQQAQIWQNVCIHEDTIDLVADLFVDLVDVDLRWKPAHETRWNQALKLDENPHVCRGWIAEAVRETIWKIRLWVKIFEIAPYLR